MLYFRAMRKKLLNATKVVIQILIAILATAFIVVGTIFVYYYAQGYRIDLNDRNVRKTGVMNIESRPSRADITLNGEDEGKTTKTVASINEGFADLKITKDGYRDWFKKVQVVSEKSTPILAELFRTAPSVEDSVTITNSKDTSLHSSITSNNNEHFIYITKEKDSTYTVWRYDLNRSFWNLNNNPHIITELLEENIKDISLLVSPSAQYITLVYKYTEEGKTLTKMQLFNTQQTETSGSKLSLEKFIPNGYTLTWSKSENYLILESSSDILSYNISNGAKYLLYKKSPKEKIVWTTDSQSNLYYTQKASDESGKYQTLEKINLDGTNSSTLIPRIYYREETKYIEEIRKKELDNIPFTNAPQNTRFIGEITNIDIDQSTKGIFISTDHSSYWYVTDIDKYIIVNPYKTTLIQYSKAKKSFIFLDEANKYLGTFTFAKEASDPVAKLGPKVIVNNLTVVDNIKWISSNNITYRSENQINIIDKDGDNKYTIETNSPTLSHSIVTLGKYLHTIETTGDSTKILRYTLQ